MARKRKERRRGDGSSSSYPSSSAGISTEETPATRPPDILSMIEELTKKQAKGIKRILKELKEEINETHNQLKEEINERHNQLKEESNERHNQLKEGINEIHNQLKKLIENHIVPRTQLAQLNGSSGDGSPAPRSEPNHIQPPIFSLKIKSRMKDSVEKGNSIITDDGDSIVVDLYDGDNLIAPRHPLASARVMMVVLDGKFNNSRCSWSKEDFEKSIKRPREGNSAIGDVNQGMGSIVSNCVFKLDGGTGRHSGATIWENSGNRKVKLGVMVLPDDSYEEYKNERVLEGVSKESFLVRDTPRPPKKQKEMDELSRRLLPDQEQNGPMLNTQYSSWPTLNTQTAGNGQLQIPAGTNMCFIPSTLGAYQQFSEEPSTNRQPSSFSGGYQHFSAGRVQTWAEESRNQPIPSPIVSIAEGGLHLEHTMHPVQLLLDRPAVEPSKRWNLLDQLKLLYSGQTKIHSGDFPTIRLMPEHYDSQGPYQRLFFNEQALFLMKMMRDLQITTIPKEVMQTRRNRGVVIQPLEPDDSDDEPPLKRKLRNKYQLRFVNKVCEAYYTWEQIKADDGNLLNVALYDENNAKITSGPLSSASVEVVVLHGDFNATGEDYWTSEEFSSCVVCPQCRELPAIGGDLVLVLVDGEASLGDAFFQKSSSYARTGKFKMGVKMKFTLEGRIQEGISESFFVRNRRVEGAEMIHPRILFESVLMKIYGTIAENTSLKGELKNGLESIGREIRTIIADIKEENSHGATRERFWELKQLAYDIEDFIDVLWEPGASGRILTAIPKVLGRIERLRKRQPSALRQLRGDNTATSGPSAGSPPYTPKAELVGIAKPKAELLELLSKADGWQPL